MQCVRSSNRLHLLFIQFVCVIFFEFHLVVNMFTVQSLSWQTVNICVWCTPMLTVVIYRSLKFKRRRRRRRCVRSILFSVPIVFGIPKTLTVKYGVAFCYCICIIIINKLKLSLLLLLLVYFSFRQPQRNVHGAAIAA